MGEAGQSSGLHGTGCGRAVQQFGQIVASGPLSGGSRCRDAVQPEAPTCPSHAAPRDEVPPAAGGEQSGRFHRSVAFASCRIDVGQPQHRVGGEGLFHCGADRGVGRRGQRNDPCGQVPAAAEAGPVIDAAIFWAAVRAAPAYGVRASAAARATASAQASSTVKRTGGRVMAGSIDQPPPRPGALRTGTPASISTWRSRCTVRVLTSNRAASSATVSCRGAAARNSSTSA